MKIIDMNTSRSRYMRLLVNVFRLTLLVIIGVGFYYMTKGV